MTERSIVPDCKSGALVAAGVRIPPAGHFMILKEKINLISRFAEEIITPASTPPQAPSPSPNPSPSPDSSPSPSPIPTPTPTPTPTSPPTPIPTPTSTPIAQKCADGTLYNHCSINKPKYCDTGNLVDQCSICECPSRRICQTDGSCKIVDSSDLKNLARIFPLYFHFTSENDATIFAIAFSSLPDNLVVWEANVFEKFIKNYFLDWIQNPRELNYSIIIKKIGPTSPSSINDLCTVVTILHEYAHFIDKSVSIDPTYTMITTKDFYSISFDMDNPYSDRYGTYYPLRRPDNIYNEFVTNYAIYGGVRTPLKNDVFAPWEDFAESFAMFISHGKVFKELAVLDPWMEKKYEWLKINVFSGREYISGDVRGIEAVRRIRPQSNEILPAQQSCDYSWRISSNFEWNYQF